MKIVYIVAALLVIGGGWYLFADQAAAPETDVVTSDADNDPLDPRDDPANENQLVVKERSNTEVTADSEEETDTMSDSEDEPNTFEVRGTNFAFDVSEIRVKEGDTVTINFESNDGFHDWVVDEFDAATEQVRPGTKTSVTFVADKAGTYEYYCSVGSHREQGMVGTLVVEQK